MNRADVTFTVLMMVAAGAFVIILWMSAHDNPWITFGLLACIGIIATLRPKNVTSSPSPST
jgi:sugar phosphate permease